MTLELVPPAADAVAASPVSRIQSLDLRKIALEGIPSPPWMVEGWIARGDIIVIAGLAGIGKSTVAADLAFALSYPCRSWLGMESDRSYMVAYCDEEQSKAETARLFLRLGSGNVSDQLFVTNQQGIRLDTDEGANELEGFLKENAVEVCFLDGSQQTFGGVDPKDSLGVGQVFGRLYGIRNRLGTSFVILAPKRKDYNGPTNGSDGNQLEKILGSVAFITQPDAVWFCRKDGADRLNITQAKRRGSKSGKAIVATYNSEGDDQPIYLMGSGATDEDTSVSGCSEWIRSLIIEAGGMVKKADITKANLALDTPYSERNLERGLQHGLNAGFIQRPKYGHYQAA